MALEWPTCDYNENCDVLIDCLDVLGLNVAKNTNHIKKWFKQKLFGIKFPPKNSLDVYLYLVQE